MTWNRGRQRGDDVLYWIIESLGSIGEKNLFKVGAFCRSRCQKFEGHLSALHIEECAFVAEEEMTIHWAVFVVEGNICKLLEEHAIHQALSLLSGAWQHLLWVKDLFLAAWERCFSLSGANTKPNLIDSYVLWASWESFCLEKENSGTFTFYHTFGVKNMIQQSHRQTEWADSHKLRKIKIFPYLKVLNVNWPSEIT